MIFFIVAILFGYHLFKKLRLLFNHKITDSAAT
jgi:hypothetical protein